MLFITAALRSFFRSGVLLCKLIVNDAYELRRCGCINYYDVVDAGVSKMDGRPCFLKGVCTKLTNADEFFEHPHSYTYIISASLLTKAFANSTITFLFAHNYLLTLLTKINQGTVYKFTTGI